jgi:hypothetical protein
MAVAAPMPLEPPMMTTRRCDCFMEYPYSMIDEFVDRSIIGVFPR